MINEYYWNYFLNQISNNNADKQAVMNWLHISYIYNEQIDEEINEGSEHDICEEPLQPEFETEQPIDFGLTSRQPLLQKKQTYKAFRPSSGKGRPDFYKW